MPRSRLNAYDFEDYRTQNTRRCALKSASIVSVAIAAGVAFALVGVALAVDLPSNMQIMCLGDSITYGGGSNNAGYRGPLYNLLNPIAPTFRFVGASTWNPGSLPANQQQHNGYPSYNTLDVANNLDGLDMTRYNALGSENRNPAGGYWLTGGHGTGRSPVFPNVILLVIGANDAGNNLDKYPDDLNTLVNRVVTLRPDAHLIMADITPFYAQVSTARTINNAVDSVAAQYLAMGKHVSVADLNTSFPSNGMSGDGVHPNDLGYAWMANQWYGAIVNSYEVPEPSTPVLLTIGLLGLLAYAWRGRKCFLLSVENRPRA